MALVPQVLRPHLTSAGKAKRRFATLEAAQAFADRVGQGKVAYPCPLDTCGGFHVGRRRRKR